MGEDERNPENMQNDRLSNLPINVLDSILVKLPLKEVVRTSILAKTWRCKWAQISQFAVRFDKSSNNLLKRTKALVNRYFLYNENEVHTFKLYRNRDYILKYLSVWLHILSRKGLKNFVFENLPFENKRGYFEYLMLPTTFFSLEKLEFLELTGCSIQVPAAFEGFHFLTRLHLTKVYWEGVENVEILINRSSNLESLKLSSMGKMRDIKIRGENLKNVELVSLVEDIKFSDARRLVNVNLTLYASDIPEPEGLSKFYLWLCRMMIILHSLSLPIELIKQETFPHVILQSDNLSSFNLCGPLHLDDEKAVDGFFSILRQFPNLKKLGFSVFCPDHYKFQEELQQSNLNKLETVSVEYYNCNLPILVEFLLIITFGSFFLETLEITKCVKKKDEIKEEHGKSYQKRLRAKFKRLKDESPSVKIIYKERLCE